MPEVKCRICQNIGNNRFITLRETKYEMEESFKYFECMECGCIQIAEIPENLADYYPDYYYSFQSDKSSPVKRYLKKKRARATHDSFNLLGFILLKFFGTPDFVTWIEPVELDFESRILDVGSGKGDLLLEMSDAGYKDLTGIDPYLDEDLILSENARVYARHLEELYPDKQFDFVMFNHSFEHLPNPLETLEKVKVLIPVGCYVLIRMPVAGKYAWEHFGGNWIQLDPPRHLHILSEKSIEILARKSSFKVDKIVYDSVGFQFWGSIQAKQGIPVWSERSYRVSPSDSIFTNRQIREFEKRAKELNADHNGDQACFYLKKS